MELKKLEFKINYELDNEQFFASLENAGHDINNLSDKELNSLKIKHIIFNLSEYCDTLENTIFDYDNLSSNVVSTQFRDMNGNTVGRAFVGVSL